MPSASLISTYCFFAAIHFLAKGCSTFWNDVNKNDLTFQRNSNDIHKTKIFVEMIVRYEVIDDVWYIIIG